MQYGSQLMHCGSQPAQYVWVPTAIRMLFICNTVDFWSADAGAAAFLDAATKASVAFLKARQAAR